MVSRPTSRINIKLKKDWEKEMADNTINGNVTGVGVVTGGEVNININESKHKTPPQLTSKLGKSTIIGRKKELQEIDQQLNSSNTLLLINGIGGVGKSNIASYYLHSQKENYDYYGFFEGLESFTTELKPRLNLQSEKPDELFLEALAKLGTLEGKKLLVLDDVKDIEENRDRIDGILALKGSGYKILFTSRSKIKDISKYTLPVLSIDDAIALFVEYYPTKDKKSVEQIVKYLDYHALFVELLAKTVQNEGYSLDEIIEKFRQGELSQIEFIDEEQGDESSFNQNLKELFEMQHQSLKEEYILLLKQLSTLPSIDLELSFLETILGKKRLKGRLTFLVNKGWLINGFGSSYKLHQIIKEYILSNYQPTFEEIEIVVDSFNAFIKNSVDAQVAVDNRENIVYFESLVALLDRLGIENEKVGDFFSYFGLIFKHLGLYKKVEPLYLKALKIREKVFGYEHPSTATSYSNLALLYKNIGKYQKIELLHMKALKIYEKVLGENHSSTATSYSNLALFYKSIREYQKAEPLYIKALKVYEKVLGEEHSSTATSYNNLAGLYKSINKYQKAKAFYLKASEIWEKVLGEEHPSTITSYNNLASLYESMEEYQKAEPLYLKTLEIWEKVLGEYHPNTATSYNNLGAFYYGQGEFEKAYEYTKRAVKVWSKVLPSNHPNLISAKEGLEIIEAKL
jgi:tetratricopeptide (TPR) repeat protein